MADSLLPESLRDPENRLIIGGEPIVDEAGVLKVVHNIKSISNQFKTMLGKLRLKRRRGKHYDMFHHLFFYDPRTLKQILETHYGFEVVVTQPKPQLNPE